MCAERSDSVPTFVIHAFEWQFSPFHVSKSSHRGGDLREWLTFVPQLATIKLVGSRYIHAIILCSRKCRHSSVAHSRCREFLPLATLNRFRETTLTTRVKKLTQNLAPAVTVVSERI